MSARGSRQLVRAALAAALAGAALASTALAGCGGSGRADEGRARLWVTRDRGAEVLLDATVPAGQTLLRALRSRMDVETRYGGRFVHAIEGIEGDAGAQSDWFWYVNGLAGDRSAAEYRLRPGDVAWWDFRSWRDEPVIDVVAGAFPEPFVHGYDGRTRPAAVRYAPGREDGARRVAEAIGADDVAPLGVVAPESANLFELVTGPLRFEASLRVPGAGPSSPALLAYAGDVDALLDGAYTRRFDVP